MNQGTVTEVEGLIENGKLVVKGRVTIDGGEETIAYLPGREKAALLPHRILGDGAEVGEKGILSKVNSLLEELVLGRTVRIWEYRERAYFAFLPWTDVNFPISSTECTSAA